ncbi:MAG: hypothetical protein Q4A83_04360 [Bacillota bacterium]|nr:hypothetical protein [Bacillota bacterium]
MHASLMRAFLLLIKQYAAWRYDTLRGNVQQIDVEITGIFAFFNGNMQQNTL